MTQQVAKRQMVLPPITDPGLHAQIDRLARRYRDAGGLGMEIMEIVGNSAEGLIERLPAFVRSRMDKITRAALNRAFSAASGTRRVVRDRGDWFNRMASTFSGAAGGVGISGVELAKAYGARVVVGVSSEEKAQMARDAGADAVVIYDRAPFDKDASKALANKFKEACEKDGYDIVYDIVGGDYSEPAVRAIGWEGRFLVTGFPAGIAKLPLNLTLLKSCDVCGVFWGAFAARFPDKNRANIAELFELWEAGKIAPPVSETYAFENAAQAIRKVGAREAVGKLVVEIG